MKRLYTPQEAQRWRRRTQGSLAICIGLAVLATAVCILLCTRVTTANASRLLLTNIILFALSGWTVILTLYYVYAPAKAQAVHIGGMLAEEPTVYEGVYALLPGAFRIPKSITVRSVSIASGEDSTSLHISAALLRHMPPAGTNLRVWTVRRFIIAYEVIT